MSKASKLSLLLISLVILLMAALMNGVIKSEHWKIKDIILKAEFKRVSSEQIRVIVAAYPQRSFFKVNANEIRRNLVKIPWVQNATVNKKWPNSLIIKVIEHQAVAVWNQDKLLNNNGGIFEVDSLDDLSALPHINGKDLQSQLIWDRYIRFNDIVKSTGLDINSATVSNRGGWNLFLSNGININLGSQQMDAKLVRLTDTWENLLKHNEQRPHYIDLRYTNGYVVKWQQAQQLKVEELTNILPLRLKNIQEKRNNNG